MKVLIVNKFLHTVGGSETYCFALEKILKKNGHEVVWFSMTDERNEKREGEKFFVKNIDYRTWNPFKKIKYAVKYLYSFEAKRKIARLLDSEKPDIVHFNLVHHQLTLSIVSEIRKRKIPIVWTLHDLIGICPNYMMLNHGKICNDCPSRGTFRPCMKNACVQESKLKSLLAYVEATNYKRMKIYDQIDAYIVPSRFYLEKYGESHFTKKPMIHIPNLLDPDTEYGCSYDRSDYVLYFGRLSKEKGIQTLIRACVKENRALWIAGKGALEKEIRSTFGEEIERGNVRLLGFKKGDELKNLIRKGKCVVLPSEWYENGPYAIMEAMAEGTPVIVSDQGGLPEMVEDEVNGRIFPYGNADRLAQAIHWIFGLSDEKYKEMCENSSRLAKEKFDADRYYLHLIALYEELVKC